jgi:hypothetical protein
MEAKQHRCGDERSLETSSYPSTDISSPNQATPTQAMIGCSIDDLEISPRLAKRAHWPPPLDIRPISSYNALVSPARDHDASEVKSKKKVTTGLGLGLPSVLGGRKPSAVRDGNDAHPFDLVGSRRPMSGLYLPKWRSSSSPIPEVPPGPASVPGPLHLPPTPRLRPVDPVDLPDCTPSPLELPSPPLRDDVKNPKPKSAPACQLYFDRISRSSSARTHCPLGAQAPTPTAVASHPSSPTRLVVPPAYRRASSFLKESIASLSRSALRSPVPPSLVGTSYLESASSPFSPHFQLHPANRRLASEVLRRRNTEVDLDQVDERWIGVNDAPRPSEEGILPQLSDSSSLAARWGSRPGGRVGEGPSGRPGTGRNGRV